MRCEGGISTLALGCKFSANLIFHPVYSFITTNRGERKGGGVGMFISDDINFKLRSDLNINEEGIIESLFIEIITATCKNIIVGTIYRPPNGKFDIFENNLSKILTKIDK